MSMPRYSAVIFLAALILAGCGQRGGDAPLSRVQGSGSGPDEFSILPGRPLEAPADTSSLPSPQPGAPNRADQDPLADGVAALGGNRRAASAMPDPRDSAVVNHANRFGGTTAIRQTLAQEDRQIRRNYGRVNILRSILPGDDYERAYSDQMLDGGMEARRLRDRGVVTPASPPLTAP